MNKEHLLPFFVAIPLAAAFLIPILTRLLNRFSSDVIAFATSLAMLVFSYVCWGHLMAEGGPIPIVQYAMGGWAPPYGINLVLDGLSAVVLMIIAVITLVVCIYSVNYMERYTAKGRYYTLLMLMVAGMNGVVLSGDIFNIYVFLELASIASYALVAFGTEHEELEASLKYLVLGSLSAAFILIGIAFVYNIAGTLNLAQLHERFGQLAGTRLSYMVVALFAAGFGLKGAMVPFHAWLPDAHPSAPAPISAMLSGLLIKALGIYAMARIFFHVFTVTPLAVGDPVTPYAKVLMAMGALSMVVGVILAVGQWDFKRLLAYHSISQMGYVVLALGLAGVGGSAAKLALLGGVFHLVNHAMFKSLLFLCSGTIEYATGTRDLKELGGLCRKMPVTSTTCAVGALSISGVPPFNGFWSKLIIIIAAVKSADQIGIWGHLIALVTVLVSFLTLVSFIKVQKYALFGDIGEKVKNVREAPALMLVALSVLALLCIGLGLWAMNGGVLDHLIKPAQEALLDPGHYADFILAQAEQGI